MSTNPNKLASKHTPGPWRFIRQAHATKKSGSGMRYSVLAYVIDHKNRDDDKWLFSIKLDKVENLNLHQEAEANAHMISAAPEAVEFIADIVAELEHPSFAAADWNIWISRAEEILKKAYNF